MIRFASKINITENEKDIIKRCLPKWDTDVKDFSPEKDFEVFFRINAKNTVEIQKWIATYQKLTNTTYSVETTYKCSGQRVIFKRSYHCQHRTRHKQTYDPMYRKRIKNTNCPSVFSVAIRAMIKKYQGKDQTKAPDKDKPCEIRLRLKHNHSTNNAMALKFRRVLPAVKIDLMNLFKQGHTAATASQIVKADIRLNYENYEKILADRSRCPNYAYCHYMYQKVNKSVNLPKFNPNFLKEKLENYNKNTNFESSRMVLFEDGYVICLCPPLVHRVHQYHQNSSEVVFMDSYPIADSNNSRLYILLTPSELGVLPLGVVIVNSDYIPDFLLGLDVLKDMLGKNAFYGNPGGPKIFFSDEYIVQNNVIGSVWPESTNLISSHHILQNVYKWLHKQTHSITSDKQIFFQDFYILLYAATVNDFLSKFEDAKQNAIKHKHYVKYLNKYFTNMSLWAACLRPTLSNLSNYSDISLRMLQDKIFRHLKSLNIVQMTDFIVNKFFPYFEQHSLDIAREVKIRNIFYVKNNFPSQNFHEKIKILQDNIRLVPSERVQDLFYVVNTDLLTCTCFYGNSNSICKHIQWICTLLCKEKISEIIRNPEMRKKYSLIATGQTSEENHENSEKVDDTNMTISTHKTDNQVRTELLFSVDNTQIDIINQCSEKKKCKENLDRMTTKFEELLHKDPKNLLASLETIYSRLKVVKTVEDISAVFGVETPGFETRNEINDNNVSIDEKV